MKRGINALVFAAAMVSGVLSTTALAAPAVANSDASPSAVMQSAGQDKPAKAVEAVAPEAAEGAVNINTATAETLAQALNGVGAKKAQAIVSYREDFGPFKTVDDLKQVPGFGNALVERNRAYIKL